LGESKTLNFITYLTSLASNITEFHTEYSSILASAEDATNSKNIRSNYSFLLEARTMINFRTHGNISDKKAFGTKIILSLYKYIYIFC
jgi:hypothetical protein